MNHLLQWESEQLDEWFQRNQLPAYRARQLRGWLFQRRAESFAEMSDLPGGLREKLSGESLLWTSRTVHHSKAYDGTEKLLLEFPGGGRIECVLLRDGHRRSICISTQVGCAMGCVFCASGLDGVERNLTRGEILEQILRLQRLLPADERLSHIVVMGMGEPLANLEPLLSALRVATDSEGLGISGRRITISTVGLPKAIHRLADLEVPYNLAVSLHAPDDALRNRLVPVNRTIGLAPILEAADRYFDVSGRRLTYEYVLLAGVNDGPDHAQGLVALLRGRSALLNVIPFNPVAGLPYQTPSAEAIQRFRQVLLSGGLNVQFRQRKGDQINAACGQLRRDATLVPLELTGSSSPSNSVQPDKKSTATEKLPLARGVE
jgi:23S rRNA (adenine2503-C2)-methyltransferase